MSLYDGDARRIGESVNYCFFDHAPLKQSSRHLPTIERQAAAAAAGEGTAEATTATRRSGGKSASLLAYSFSNIVSH